MDETMKIFLKMMKDSMAGFNCAQLLMTCALDEEGKTDPDLLRAIGGLNMGFYYNGGPCGALTGGCCLISYFAGKGEADEIEHENLQDMLKEYVEWFRKEQGGKYGGESCDCILDGKPENKTMRCPSLIHECYVKAMEIVKANEE